MIKSSEKIGYETVSSFRKCVCEGGSSNGKSGALQKPCLFIAKLHYADPTRTRHGPDTDKVRARCRVRAKFHYTDPTGPTRTQRSFAAKKSVRVRAGPCRVRVVEFSFYATKSQRATRQSQRLQRHSRVQRCVRGQTHTHTHTHTHTDVRLLQYSAVVPEQSKELLRETVFLVSRNTSVKAKKYS